MTVSVLKVSYSVAYKTLSTHRPPDVANVNIFSALTHVEGKSRFLIRTNPDGVPVHAVPVGTVAPTHTVYAYTKIKQITRRGAWSAGRFSQDIWNSTEKWQ